MIMSTALLSAAGFLVSLYGNTLERAIQHDPEYKPFCDISETVSCTKPFKSAYGKTVGFSNTLLGMIFYAAIFLLSVVGARVPLFYCSLAAVAVSVYLAYVLYAKIKSFCVVCITVYIINIALLMVSMRLIS